MKNETFLFLLFEAINTKNMYCLVDLMYNHPAQSKFCIDEYREVRQAIMKAVQSDKFLRGTLPSHSADEIVSTIPHVFSHNLQTRTLTSCIVQEKGVHPIVDYYSTEYGISQVKNHDSYDSDKLLKQLNKLQGKVDTLNIFINDPDFQPISGNYNGLDWAVNQLADNPVLTEEDFSKMVKAYFNNEVNLAERKNILEFFLKIHKEYLVAQKQLEMKNYLPSHFDHLENKYKNLEYEVKADRVFVNKKLEQYRIEF